MGKRTLASIPITTKIKERFWSHVDVKEPDKCWLWQSCLVRDYGQFQLAGRGRFAHRVAYWLWYEDPGDMFVCHSCDTPLCVNPRHLFLGTVKDNNADSARKGRRPAKLSPSKVVAIRSECVPGSKDAGYSALARKYNCNPGAIWQAVNRTRWEHVE